MRTNRLLLTAVAVSLFAAACTGGVVEGPPSTTPSIALAPTTSTTVVTTTTTAPPVDVTLFFPNPSLEDAGSRCGRAFPVLRSITPGAGGLVESVLAALLDGPSADESSEGFTAVAPPSTAMPVVTVDGSVVRIDLPAETAAGLTGVCAGTAFRAALSSTIQGLSLEPVLTLGGSEDLASEVVGATCTLPSAAPDAVLVVYLHCGPGANDPPVAVNRSLPPDTDTATALETAMASLALGPSPEERAGGLWSALVEAGANLPGPITINGTAAVVDFEAHDRPTGDFGTGAGGVAYMDELLATAFQFPEIERVTFTLGGSCEAFAAQFESECRTYSRRDADRALLDREARAAYRGMEGDLTTLSAKGPRPAGSDAERAVGDLIVNRLTELSSAVGTDDVPLPDGGTTRNIWTWFGSGDTEILLGAHYDSVSVSPGIDDNGSGVVILLELARRLAMAPPANVRVRIVFFGGEEVLAGFTKNDHHFGSRKMASDLASADDLPELMVSVDMVGVGSMLYAVTYLDTDPAAAEALMAAGSAAGVDIAPLSRGDISDHEAFARAGTPAVFMWRPDNPGWHTAGDDRADPLLLLEDLAVLEQLITTG